MVKTIIAFCIVLCISVSSCGSRDITEEHVRSFAGARQVYADGDTAAAEKICREIIKSRKDFDQARLLLARCLFFQERYREAEEQLAALVKRRPAFRDAELLYINLLLETGRSGQAGGMVDALLSLDPLDPRLLYLRALADQADGDLAGALWNLRQAGLFAEEYARVFLDLGRLYYIHRLEGPAFEEIDKALALLPRDSLLRKPVEELKEKMGRETGNNR